MRPLTGTTQGPRHPSSDSILKTIARALLSAEDLTLEKMMGGPTAGRRARKLQQIELFSLGVEHPHAVSTFDEALVTTLSKRAVLRTYAMGDPSQTIGDRLLRPFSRTGLLSPEDARPRAEPLPQVLGTRYPALKGEAGTSDGHHLDKPSVRALHRTCTPPRQRLYMPLL